MTFKMPLTVSYLRKVTKFQRDGVFRFGVLGQRFTWKRPPLPVFIGLSRKWNHINRNRTEIVHFLTLLAPGGMFSTPSSITPLSLKLDYSNFVQNYFGIR